MHAWLTALTLQNTEIEAVFICINWKIILFPNILTAHQFCTLGLHFTLSDVIIFSMLRYNVSDLKPHLQVAHI